MIHALENNDLQTGYNLPIDWDNPTKKFTHRQHKIIRDKLDGTTILLMMEYLREHKHKVSAASNMEMYLSAHSFPVESLADTYDRMREPLLPSQKNSGHEFWRCAWGVYTCYLEAAHKYNEIEHYNKRKRQSVLFTFKENQ